jgi:hypothetical protein
MRGKKQPLIRPSSNPSAGPLIPSALTNHNGYKILKDFCGAKKEEFITQKCSRKEVVVDKGDLFVEINGEFVSYTDIFTPHSNEKSKPFFYVFAPLAALDNKKKLIEALKAKV